MRRTEQAQGLRLMKFEEVYGRTRRGVLGQACCSACNFYPQYQAISIAYRADRRATHAPNNSSPHRC